MALLYRLSVAGTAHFDEHQLESLLSSFLQANYGDKEDGRDLSSQSWIGSVRVAENDGLLAGIIRAQAVDGSVLHQVSLVLSDGTAWAEMTVSDSQAAENSRAAESAVPSEAKSLLARIGDFIELKGLPLALFKNYVSSNDWSIADFEDLLQVTQVPLALVPDDDQERQAASCERLTHQVLGMAAVVACSTEEAEEILNKAKLNVNTEVRAGSLITISRDSHSLASDYIPPYSVVRQQAGAMRRIRRSCLDHALSVKLPDKVARAIATCESLAAKQGTSSLWQEAALDLDQENEALREQIALIESERDYLILDQEEVEQELDEAQRTLRWLRNRLNELGDFGLGGETPEDESISVTSCEQCCQKVQEMPNVWFSDAQGTVRQLDRADKRTLWARKAHRAFTALNDYATAKAQGEFRGSFLLFCSDPPVGSGLPSGWVALKESLSTSQRPETRAQRTFTIPERVSPVGAVYMEAHIKLSNSDSLAPRIHFFDDTDGKSGKILVGYFGPHLDTGG